MIIGIGIDVVDVERLRQWEKDSRIFDRFFHPDEIKTAKERGSNLHILSLAARFAAKEAFGKALGTGLKGFSLKEIAVLNNENGKPDMYLYGAAKRALEKHPGAKVHVSLTHERDYALAEVIIEV